MKKRRCFDNGHSRYDSSYDSRQRQRLQRCLLYYYRRGKAWMGRSCMRRVYEKSKALITRRYIRMCHDMRGGDVPDVGRSTSKRLSIRHLFPSPNSTPIYFSASLHRNWVCMIGALATLGQKGVLSTAKGCCKRGSAVGWSNQSGRRNFCILESMNYSLFIVHCTFFILPMVARCILLVQAEV